MANGGRIDYTIGFNVDKSGLNDLQKQLAELQNLTPDKLLTTNFKPESKQYQQTLEQINEIKKAAAAVGPALQKSFNPRLNIHNVQTFTNEINKTYGSVNKLMTTLNQGGIVGQQAAAKISASFLTAQTSIKKTETILDKMGTTLLNTVKWTFSSSIINRFTGAISSAIGYVKHLDSSLNDIRIVTGKSADEMGRFAVQANNAAKQLGKTTTDYTEASLIYYQQGLGDQEVAARTATTLKAANVTGQSTSAVSEELTAVWNGYKVGAEETEAAIDKLAAVAATTASDLQELSTGMSKVASAANAMGVDMDQLNAQIATIISVTRQAPESVGTALKTIYARLADLKLGDTDEDGLGLGDVSGTLDKVGIAVLDATGDLREMGDVIEDVAAKWNTWTAAQQTAIAQVMAGKRQYNNLVALFENWDMYSSALETSQDSLGTLQKQQDIYMESTTAHINQLKAQWEDLYDSLLDADTINGVTDFLTKIVSLTTDFIDIIGGGKGALTHIIGLLGTLFSGKIASGISELWQRVSDNKAIDKLLDANLAFAKATKESGNTSGNMAQAYEMWGKYAKDMTNEQREQAMGMMKEVEIISKEVDLEKEKEKELKTQLETQKDLRAEKEKEAEQAKRDLQLSKEKSAERIKEVEKNLSNSNALVPNTTGTRINKDYSEAFTKTNLSDYWKTNDNDIKRIKEDLDNLIETANTASQKITNIIKKQPEKIFNEKGNAIFDPKQWDKWSEQAVNGIKAAKEELKTLKQAGILNDNEYNRLNTLLGKSLTKDEQGVNKTNWESTKKALLEIKALANQTSNEFTNIKKIMGEDFDTTPYTTELEAIDAQIKRIEQDTANLTEQEKLTLEALKAQKEAIEAQTAAYEKQRQIKTVTSIASGLIQLGNTYSTVSNLAKQFANNQITLSSALSGFGSIIITTTTLVSNFKRVAESLGVNITKKIAMAWTGVGIAIGAAVAAVNFALEKYQQSLERTAEIDKINAERNQEYVEVLEKQKEGIEQLANSYKNLQEQLDDHSISVEDARNQVYDLCKQYDLQDLAVKALIEDYNNLGGAIETANTQIQEDLLKRYQKQADLTFKASKSSIKASTENWQRDTINGRENIDLLKQSQINGDIYDEATVAALQDLGKKLNLNLNISSPMDNANDFGHLDLDNLMEAYARDEAALWDIVNNYDTDIAKNLGAYLIAHRNDLDAYKDDFQKERNQQAIVTANQTIDKENITSVTEYQQAKKDLKEALKDNFDSEEEVNSFVEKYLNGIDEIKEYAQQADIAQALQGSVGIGEQTSKGPFGMEITLPKQLMEEDKRQNLINRIQEEGLSNEALGISAFEWESYFNAGFDEDKIIEIIKNKQARAFNEAAKEFNLKELPGLNESFASVMSDVSSGEKIDTSTEEYVKMQEDIRKAIEYNSEAFADLNGEVQTFFDESMVGTEQWIQSAYKLQQALDGIEFDKELKEYSDALDSALSNDKLSFKVDDSELQETLDNIMNEDYDISVKIHTEAEEDFENIANSLNRIDSLADKIGEDFIVAADDIRELNNAFPGILQGMTYLADGTIQLNEEVAKSAMDTAAQESASAVEATTTKLKASATELRAKAEIYDQMAAEAKKAAEDETYAATAKTNIVKDLMEIESKNNEAVENQKIDNANAVVDNSAVNAPILAENWDSAYQAATNAVNEWATVATEANAAVARGDKSWSKKGNFGHTFTGKSHTSSEGAQAAQLESQSAGEIDWGSIANSYTNQATALRAQANDIEGMIATLGAKAINTAAKTGGVGAKSGSGSGGGSSEKEAKHEEYLEREEDIYREINEQLDQIESTLGRIQKINDHEWGYDAQVTLEKENKLLEEQLEKLQKKKELQVGDLSYRRKQLEDVGVNFSDDGSSMSNAEAVLNALYAHYNQMVDVYNAMSAAEQETYKAELDAEKERIDIIDNKISDYESLYSEYQSTLDDILDKHFEQIENTVNQFNNMVEVHLELDDAKKEWTDFWYDVVKDVEENNFAEQIAKSMSKLGVLVGVGLKDASGSQVAELTRHTAETVAEVSKQIQSAGSGGNLSIFGDDSKLAYETLKDYRDKLMSALEDAEKEVDRVGEVYLQILDDAQNKIDKQVESWSAIGDQLQNNIDLITLVSGDDSYAALAKQFELQYNNNLELVETQRRSKEYWQQEIDKYKSLLASTKEGSKEWKTYSEALEKSTENFKKAIQDLDSTVKKAIEDLNKWKESQTKALLDTIDKNLSAGMGLSDLEDEWTLINRYANRYFDQVERSLAMEDVNLTFDKLLDNTNLSVDAQKKLNALREEEVKRLTEKDKLTQYDIDELKARLEITKQQMALEDAQRAKTNLRLRRDSQGNYSYQYTANESDLLSGREGMLSAKKDWYKLVKNNMTELSNDILSINKELNEKMSELANTNWENNREGEERLKNEIKQLLEEKLFLEEQYSVGRQQLFKGTAEYFKEVEEAGMFPQWKSTLMQMSNAWYDGGKESFIGTVQDGIQKIKDLDEAFRERHHAILEDAGIDYANLRDNGIDPTIDALDDLTDSNEELAESLDETNALLDQQAINLKQVEEAYNALKTAAVEAVESANKVLEELSKTAIETQQQVAASVQAAQSAAAITSSAYSSSSNNSGSGGSGGSGGYSSSSARSVNNTYKVSAYDKNGYMINGYPKNLDKQNAKSAARTAFNQGYSVTISGASGILSISPAKYGYWKANDEANKAALNRLAQYRSGGYTGTWEGSNKLDGIKSGRLAFLHQKELVLNEQDTKNVLEAVNVLRGISINQVAEGIIAASRAASTAINGVGAGLMQTIAGLTQNVQSGDTNTYSRNMTVNADFSGVKSAEAIYQALMELDNYGMQNAYSNAPHMNRAY